jgi:hypothetical protein
MDITTAQQAYDLRLPDEWPDHRFTGEVFAGDNLFLYENGRIFSVIIDDEGTQVPYSEWEGCMTIVRDADIQAYLYWKKEVSK